MSDTAGRNPVAICVVTHNAARDLAPLMQSLRGLDHRPLELVVVDSASTDETRSILDRQRPGSLPIRTVWLEQNRGFAPAMNAALAVTEAPYILALNPDTRPEPTFLSTLLDRFAAHPRLRVGAVTGRLVRFPNPGSAPRLDACGMYLTWTWRHLDRGSGVEDHQQWCEAERVFGATGAATLYLRAALDDVAIEHRVFADEFHTYREDAELCFRLRERGWEILYEPAARAEHRRVNLPQRRRQMSSAVNYHSLKNRYLLRAYHQTVSNLLLTLLPATGRDLAALLYCLAFERESLSAYAWLWRHRREIAARRKLIQSRRRMPAASIDAWFFRRSRPL